MDKQLDKLLPITWTGWNGDLELVVFSGVEFQEDFGTFKKGEKLSSLVISYTQGEVKEFNDAGEVVRDVKVKLVPI